MSIFNQFQNPPKTHSPLAFWFWNGELEPDRLRQQIDELYDKGVYGAFMHPRGYLKTPYLEEPWWEAISAAVDQAKKKGMYAWMYDEYAWPSGTAGCTFEYGFQKPSRILAEGEQNMAKGLAVRIVGEDGVVLSEGGDGKIIARYALTGEGDSLTIKCLAPDEAPASGSRLMEFRLEIYPTAIDYMNAETFRRFLDITHEEYKKRYKGDFGKTIPGIFFDEIYLAASTLPWTDRLPEEFTSRMGKDLLDSLPYLMEDGGSKGRQARLDYYTVITQLYEEAFFKQIGDWCAENGLDLTGHTEEFLTHHPKRQGNFFDTMRHLQIPGADCHDYRYRFPRKITYSEPKYAVALARAYDKPRAMSEAMGGAGWGCSLQEFKRGVNTLAAMGINMLVLHGFYYEAEHQGSQADWPTSFFYQNPYWKYFKQFADYMSRVSVINAAGRAVVEVGLYYPIEDIQANTIAGDPNSLGRSISEGFHDALSALVENQIDVDFIDRKSILAADVAGGQIAIAQQRFKVLVMPEAMMPDAELEKQLALFTQAGGKIIKLRCDGSDIAAISAKDVPQAVSAIIPPDIQVIEGSRFDLFTCHREIEGEDWYFVSNSSPRTRTVKLRLRAPFMGGLKKYCIETGNSTIIPAKAMDGGTVANLYLEADEACYLVPCKSLPTGQYENAFELAIAGRWAFMPLDNDCIQSQEATLEIPTAILTTSLHPDPTEIRIQNTAWEDGHAGRHLGLWDGKWITRRPSWHCGPYEADLYFRRSFNLQDAPSKACVCIAAVNEFTLYVNGKEVSSKVESNQQPHEIDISAYLTTGDNLLAVHVHNHTPYRGSLDFNSVEELPPDRLITLLLQCEIAMQNGETITLGSNESWIVSNRHTQGWHNPGGDYEPKAYYCDASAHQSQGRGAAHGEWIYAWERGAVPISPWGEVPLFGKTVSYPVELNYDVTIPAGAISIAKPVINGCGKLRLDGVPFKWQGETLDIRPVSFPRRLSITVIAASPECGLAKPVSVKVAPFLTALGDWRLHGLPWYSGKALYKNKFKIDKQDGHYHLELGRACFSAEIWINGKLADIRIWEPYRADITDLLQDGENEIAVVIANSAAVERRNMLVDEGQALGWARYWNRDNMDREGENLVSGLLGPVRIFLGPLLK